MKVIRTGPKSQPGPAEEFTGAVWIDQIALDATPSRLRVYSVHFGPGARTAWHHHPYGQILHVVEGVGRAQQSGDPVHEIRAGDTVVIEPGKWHWHGAAPKHFMTHFAIHQAGDDGAGAKWGDHVTDAEYLVPPANGSASDLPPMESGVMPPRDLTAREKILLAEYAEVCKTHAGITDFRAKLLALLPIASVAGIGLLIARETGIVSRTEAGLLIALGIFGAVITAGLFLYELRQIDHCKQLENHADWTERQLGLDGGQFGGRRARLSLREIYSPSAHRLRDEDLTAIEKKQACEPTPAPQRKHGLVRKRFVGAEAAGYVVYHAVIIAWLLVAAFGLAKLA
jgi:quercetin dioxygenase-like cupin family protein